MAAHNNIISTATFSVIALHGTRQLVSDLTGINSFVIGVAVIS